MVDERILETLRHRGSEFFELRFRQIQRRNDLIVNRLVHKPTDYIVMHTVSYNILPCEVGAKHEASVGTVQNTDLSLLVWFMIVCD